MKNTYKNAYASVSRSSYNTRTIALSVALVSLLSYTLVSSVSALYYEPLTGQMSQGSRGANVSRLQTFISANPSIYPEGLVTGYYGSLTTKAVVRFQSQYGISQVGRVGPATLSKMNSLIANGGWTESDSTGPSFYNVTSAVGPNYLTFSFNTDEVTMARVVYNTSPLMFNEGDINSNGFGAIGGYAVNSTSGLSTSHSITLPNLINNMPYYYTIVATDNAGNVSVWGPNNRVMTNN